MTNAEKYKEIFGFEPDMSACPTNKCINCPHSGANSICLEPEGTSWWEEDYKENKKEKQK